MNELIVNTGIAKPKRIANIVIGSYLLLFCLYFFVEESMRKSFGLLFYASLIGILLAAIVLFGSLWAAKPTIKIDTTSFVAHLPMQKEKDITIIWADVSRVNIGLSYLVFILNGGQNQKNIDLSALSFNDLKLVKSKVIEMNEQKNIPYHND